MEIVNAQISFLTNDRLKGFQNEMTIDNNELQSDSFGDAINVLKSLTSEESDDMFQFLVEELVNHKITERARQMTEGSLHKTIIDLRHTLQLMRKAAVESALENENKIQELEKKHEEEKIIAERRIARLKGMTESNKRRPPALPISTDDDRGRKMSRDSSKESVSSPDEKSDNRRRAMSVSSITRKSSINRSSTEASLAPNGKLRDENNSDRARSYGAFNSIF